MREAKNLTDNRLSRVLRGRRRTSMKMMLAANTMKIKISLRPSKTNKPSTLRPIAIQRGRGRLFSQRTTLSYVSSVPSPDDAGTFVVAFS